MDIENPDNFGDAPESENEAEMDPTERKYKYLTDGGRIMPDAPEGEDGFNSDFSDDKKVDQADRMNEEIEGQLTQQREYQMLKTKKEWKKEEKTKLLVDQHRQRRLEKEGDDYLANEELLEDRKKGADESENDDDLDEEREIQKIIKE